MKRSNAGKVENVNAVLNGNLKRDKITDLYSSESFSEAAPEYWSGGPFSALVQCKSLAEQHREFDQRSAREYSEAGCLSYRSCSCSVGCQSLALPALPCC